MNNVIGAIWEPRNPISSRAHPTPRYTRIRWLHNQKRSTNAVHLLTRPLVDGGLDSAAHADAEDVPSQLGYDDIKYWFIVSLLVLLLLSLLLLLVVVVISLYYYHSPSIGIHPYPHSSHT